MKYLKKATLLRLLSLLCLLSLLVGCTTHASRPDDMTWTEESESTDDIPVNGGDDTPKKRIALTFDDGPQHYRDQTKNIVNELDKYGYHATFFVVGNRVPGGDTLAYAVQKGNELGIHGYSHSYYYDSCTEDELHRELNRTAQEIREQVPGYEIKLMRPVGGRITEQRIADCPYAVIHWSVDSNDWNAENRYFAGITDEECVKRTEKIVGNILSDLQDGDIVLMHDIYESTYDAVKLLLPRLKDAGYEVVTVSELLGERLESGNIYYATYK